MLFTLNLSVCTNYFQKILFALKPYVVYLFIRDKSYKNLLKKSVEEHSLPMKAFYSLFALVFYNCVCLVMFSRLSFVLVLK
jgi:hypothetical protein